MATWEKGGDFRARLAADPAVTRRLSPAVLARHFDLGYHTKHVDTIFRRVFAAPRRATRR
jgi:adenylosuccinate lyase